MDHNEGMNPDLSHYTLNNVRGKKCLMALHPGCGSGRIFTDTDPYPGPADLVFSYGTRYHIST